jgi:hypothetical protein
MSIMLITVRPLVKLPEDGRFDIFDSILVYIEKEKGYLSIVQNKFLTHLFL